MVHVAIILFLTFSPAPEKVGGSMVARAYQYFVHIGPFFREDAIQASQHVVASYQKEGEWNHIDLTDSLVQGYLRSPWQTQKLSLRDRIRENARNLVGKKGWRNSGELKNVYRYAESRYPELSNSDSLGLIFIIRWYKPELKRHVADTLYQYTFGPTDE